MVGLSSPTYVLAFQRLGTPCRQLEPKEPLFSNSAAG